MRIASTLSLGYVILLSLAVALLLSSLPLPIWVEPYLPMWALLVYCYWAMAVPERIGPVAALALGLLLDVLQGSVLGEHALALIAVAYLIGRTYPRLRMYPVIRQSIAMLSVLMVYLLVRLVVRMLIGTPPAGLLYFAPLPLSVLLWPWIFLLLRDIRRWAPT